VPVIAIGRISHETNSFSPVPTTLDSFREGEGILEGEALVRHHTGAKTGLGGFLDVAAEERWRIAGTLGAGATPSGNVAAAAHAALRDGLLARLSAAGRLDGVLLHLHGAMCSDGAPDAEGDICRHVRAAVGPEVPVVVELDLHGNMTAAFCEQVDAVFGYRTNPHVDPYERGLDAARCLARMLRADLARPKVYIAKPPMLPPTINMRTAEGPMHDLFDQARAWERQPHIVNVSVFGGFPYADFDQAGTAILVTATDPAAGRSCAEALGRQAWELREAFLKPLPSVPEAVDRALRLLQEGQDTAVRPIVLADVADNPGGGGTGDTTELLRELIARRARGAVACVWDPATARGAHDAGLGAVATFRIGGKMAPAAFGAPVEVSARVAHLSGGEFVGSGPVVRGRTVRCGPTAQLDAAGLKIIVTSVRHAANDRGFFRIGGVDPEREPLLLIKSRGHFRADFEPIARTIIEVDAPGAANPNLDRFRFARVRRPIWPLDRDMSWSGAHASR
jgi:microcystin degradation protein MlrC